MTPDDRVVVRSTYQDNAHATPIERMSMRNRSNLGVLCERGVKFRVEGSGRRSRRSRFDDPEELWTRTASCRDGRWVADPSGVRLRLETAV